jgi:hypothetical protein
MKGKNIETNTETSPVPAVSFSALLWIFFAASIQFIRDFLHFLIRNILLIGIFFLVGLALGYITHKGSEKSYQVSMIVKSAGPGAITMDHMVEHINQLLSTKPSEEAAEKLHTSPAVTDAFLSLSSRPIKGEGVIIDSPMSESRFFVLEMKIKEAGKSDTLQNLILDYFNRNPYLARFQEEKSRMYERQLTLLDEEINSLNAWKEAIYSKAGKAARIHPGKIPDLAAINLRLSESHKEKERILEWFNPAPATVVKIDTVTSPLIQERGLFKRMISFGFAFFIIGCIIAASVVVIRQKGS